MQGTVVTKPLGANEETLRKLWRLIDLCEAGEEIFAQAAVQTNNPRFKRMLEACAHQRARFALELRAQIQRGGVDFQQWLANSQSAIAAENEKAVDFSHWADAEILNACRETEQSILRQYEQALRGPLPLGCRFLLQAQYALLRQSSDSLRSFAGLSLGRQIELREHALA